MRYSLANLLVAYAGGDAIGAAIGFNIGWENRKPITSKLQFLHGFEPGFFLSPSIAELRLGYVLGFQYSLSDELFMNIETVPNASATVKPRLHEYRFDGLTNIALTLGYTFTKPKKEKRKKKR